MTGLATKNSRTTSRWCWRGRAKSTLGLGRVGGGEPPSPEWSPAALTEAMLPPHREKRRQKQLDDEAFLRQLLKSGAPGSRCRLRTTPRVRINYTGNSYRRRKRLAQQPAKERSQSGGNGPLGRREILLNGSFDLMWEAR